jgi:hypothetical protein
LCCCSRQSVRVIANSFLQTVGQCLYMITTYVSSGYNSINLFAYYTNGDGDGNAVHLGISPDTPMMLLSMDMLRGRTGKRKVVVTYMNAPLPYTIEDSLGRCFFEDDDDDLAQVLQDQVGWCYYLFTF